MSLRIFAGSVVLSVAALGASNAMAQDASIDQVYQTIRAGRLADAQGMMDKVLRDHPNSAQAHYVEAELLAREGNMPGAQTELANAERINPSLSFAKPEAVQELRNQITATRAPAPRTNSYAPPPANYGAPAPQPSNYVAPRSSGLPWGVIGLFILLILFIVMVARAFGRRNVVMASSPPVYGGGFGGGMPMGGGYGPGGYPMGGGGIGSGIVGGLATGAALGAGMVAGEELVHHFTDGNRDNYIPNQGGGGWDNAPPAQNTDMGGNDFGISDAGSWDSGGGGGGGGDSGGGGGDWN